jgi:exodeoxyribonuclease-3
MKISTFNICGWNSAIRKGLAKWIKDASIDVLAVQELRSKNIIKPLELINYSSIFNPSKYQGTAIISKDQPISVSKRLGFKRFDDEGRFIQVEFEKFIFINVYLPHGRRDKKDLPYKLKIYNFFINYLSRLLAKNEKPIVIGGDFNVAHKEIDLAKPKENEENIMFTIEERRQIDKIIELGFIDAFRRLHKEKGYTWWLRAFNSKERDIGWRIDYIFISKQLSTFLKSAFVPDLDISDHCPVIIELEI